MMELELGSDQKFAFAAIAAMSLVSLAAGERSEDELEEIYIQIHESDVISNETEFALEALEELNDRLELNFSRGKEEILADVIALQLEHEQSVEIINMALDVVKSNKVVVAEKIDMLSEICHSLNLYSSDFSFTD